MEWWVAKGGGTPVGPVSTELLLRGIGAGKVPKDALVCEVGGSSWRSIGETAPFSLAIKEPRARRRLDSGDDLTLADPPAPDEDLSRFDDSPEQTTQTTVELPRRWFDSLSDTEDQTTVDLIPVALRASEPPSDA